MQKNESLDIFLVFNALEAFGTEYAERNLRPNETITRTVSNNMGKNFLQVCKQDMYSNGIDSRGHTHNNNNNNNNNNENENNNNNNNNKTDNLDKK